MEFKNANENIIDVIHMFANDNKQIHERLDNFLDRCKEYKLEEYCSYNFFEVNFVDGLHLDLLFNKYHIEGNKIKLK